MALNKYKLGELIKVVDERNAYGIKDFYGINIDKEFMPTVANTEGLDESNYKVVRENRFVFSGMQTGRDECIRISMYLGKTPIIVSPAYTTFEISATDVVLPTYFFMIFLSKEKDRLGWFYSDGSIRSNLDWDRFCDMELNLPDLPTQQKYVDIYKAMVANQQCYERGLDDLKLGIDAFIDEIKHKSETTPVRELLKEVDARNESGEITIAHGINIAKQFMPSVADTNGVDLTKYKLVEKNQPSGGLGEEESALAQCFMAIAGFVRKMSGTDTDIDADTMNRRVAEMVEQALKYNDVESILDDGEQEDLFSPEFFEKLADVKMPATKLEMLVKMLRKQIREYGKTNQMAARKFQEMLEETVRQYHERRKHLSEEEAGETQEQTANEIIRNATEQALQILKSMNADRESFRKIGLTFEEKAFYDILMDLRDRHSFVYGEDRLVGGVSINEKCKSLAKKVKEIIDTKSSFSDWLNNQIVRDRLKFDIKVCLIKNGYPPKYSPEVFRKVMEQVENFEENSSGVLEEKRVASYSDEETLLMVSDPPAPYGR